LICCIFSEGYNILKAIPLHKKKHLQFSALRKLVSKRVREIDDARAPGKVKHDIHDCCLSTLAMMFFQDPSINKFQLRLQKKLHKNNLGTLFKVNTIPKETQMREVLDSIPSIEFEPIFADFFKPLQRGKQIEQFQIFNGSHHTSGKAGSLYCDPLKAVIKT
jgi:hypothetical protein